MKEIKNLNQELTMSEDSNLDTVITELLERNEFSCTGNTCPVHCCKIVGIEETTAP